MNVYSVTQTSDNITSKLRSLLKKYDAVLLPKDAQPDRTRILFQNQELKKKASEVLGGFNYTHTEAPALATFKSVADIIWELKMLG